VAVLGLVLGAALGFGAAAWLLGRARQDAEAAEGRYEAQARRVVRVRRSGNGHHAGPPRMPPRQ
jgi:hypothetical protein